MGFSSTSNESYPGNTFEEFRKTFPYQNTQLFNTLFNRNQALIKLKKASVAAANLEKIFAATFKLSSKYGFHDMSLRHLSRETNISMGGLYSCLNKKEDIATMVLDMVELVTTENNAFVVNQNDELLSIEIAIKYHLYTSALLQPWFFFLYFETRSLSNENQLRSKEIEMQTILTIQEKIQQGVENQRFDLISPYFVANTIVITLQDWYLKPWKNKENNIGLEEYCHYLFIMVKKLLKLTD